MLLHILLYFHVFIKHKHQTTQINNAEIVQDVSAIYLLCDINY